MNTWLQIVFFCLLYLPLPLLGEQTKPGEQENTAHTSIEEFRQNLNFLLKEHFSDASPLVSDTEVIILELKGLMRTYCMREISKCDIVVSPAVADLGFTTKELIVLIGHEVGHLIYEAEYLRGRAFRTEDVLGAELLADAFGANSRPEGACHLARALKGLVLEIKKNHELTPGDASKISTRLKRLRLLCNDQLDGK